MTPLITPREIAIAQEGFAKIVGEPLTDMRRYLNVQAFEFGVQKPDTNRRGQPITRADWTASAGCWWSVTSDSGFELNKGHFHPERADDFADPFYDLLSTHPLVVVNVRVSERGVIHIEMDRGYRIEFEVHDCVEWTDEAWRLTERDGRILSYGQQLDAPEGWTVHWHQSE